MTLESGESRTSDNPRCYPQRSAYMNGDVTFAEFYRSVYEVANLHPAMLRSSGIDKDWVQRTLRHDEHLNLIPMSKWDGLSLAYRIMLRRSLKLHGDFWSLAGGVCAFKQMARDWANGVAFNHEEG